ncbi:MAG: baseplate J/gp47 family protein [Thermoflexales bacterium]|nr:baseplate J/gp47 family protein [Thermoflexales bacterium]MDW8351569.1 baseplate J/gp47 family protein [Anaerolineae bacterium]
MVGRIITLDLADDVSGARERIEWAGAERVVLVMPEGMRWREVDFARLRRIAQERGIEVAIVNRDLQQRKAAQESGLLAFADIHAAVHRPWLRDDGIEPIRRLQPPRRFAPDSLRRFFPLPGRLLWVGRGLISLVALATIAAVVFILLPRAEITLTASSQPIRTIIPVTLDVRADRVNVEARVIPARRVDVIVEGRMSTNATGEKSVPRSKARGRVTFTNVLATPFVVPRNTVVRTTATSTPARFVTLADVEVPPGGRAEVEIEAIEEGPAANVAAGQINQVEGVPALAVTVFNAAPTGGGGNVILPAVTEEDYRRLRRALREKLLREAAEKIQQQREVVNDGLIVLPETLFIAERQDETFDRFVTEQADSVTLNMRLQVAGLAVSPRDLETIAREVLKSKTPEGFELLSVEAWRGEAAEEGTGNDTLLFIEARGLAGAAIDENAVRRLVRGKTPADAQAALLQNFALKRNPRIEAGPDWLMQYVNRLPLVTLRIETKVQRE